MVSAYVKAVLAAMTVLVVVAMFPELRGVLWTLFGLESPCG
jgi:hypothetical protein